MDRELAADLDAVLDALNERPEVFTRFEEPECSECVSVEELIKYVLPQLKGEKVGKYVNFLIQELQKVEYVSYIVKGHVHIRPHGRTFIKKRGGYSIAWISEKKDRARRAELDRIAHEANLLAIANANKQTPWYKKEVFRWGMIGLLMSILTLLFNPPFNWKEDGTNETDNKRGEQGSNADPHLPAVQIVPKAALHDSARIDTMAPPAAASIPGPTGN